ncbi:MAG: PstS family phosphate ABC transporter substrate-binding protein [Bacteroidales bacterium]|jgi:phosphate transport system substrate-binding protein|nr:PstS family phosphate ABC transporter substrate-binding protein [Bacteroidales bacterium]
MRKTFTVILIVLLLLPVVIFIILPLTKTIPPSELTDHEEYRISISGAFALYPMAIKWSEEFRKINPGIKIDISAGGAGKGIADVLSGMVDIGMVSREIYFEEIKKGAIPISVAKDAVVATISDKNPAINDILAKGLNIDAGASIWITGSTTTWEQAFGVKSKAPVHVYTRSDACGAAEIWAMMYGKKQEDLLGVGVFGDPGLAQAVKRDPLGIGFNNIGYAYDADTKLPISGIKIVPLDLNGNGKIDHDESFYNTMNDIIAAIAAGKYPSPPARELYFVIKSSSVNNKILSEFIKFVLTSGQQYVHEAGYIQLSNDKLSEELKKLN